MPDGRAVVWRDGEWTQAGDLKEGFTPALRPVDAGSSPDRSLLRVGLESLRLITQAVTQMSKRMAPAISATTRSTSAPNKSNIRATTPRYRFFRVSLINGRSRSPMLQIALGAVSADIAGSTSSCCGRRPDGAESEAYNMPNVRQCCFFRTSGSDSAPPSFLRCCRK